MSSSLPVAIQAAGVVTKADGLELARVYATLSVSENTKRAYKSAVRRFLEWGGKLPAAESDVLGYLGANGHLVRPDTLALHLAAISAWHRHGKWTDPTKSASVSAVLSGLRRTYIQAKKKARPLLLEDLVVISECLGKCDTLRAKRDRALLLIGFFGGFRRTELVAIEFQDLELVDKEGYSIEMRRSKTDQEGHGASKGIPYGDAFICPVTALKEWIDAASIKGGPIFRAISRNGTISSKALHAASVVDIIVSAAKAAGLDSADQLSGHSLRRGMATSARHHGSDREEIMRQGGWKDARVVQGYIDEADLFKNAAGRMLGKPASS